MANRSDIRAIHFIGIGGVGMSGIAHVAHDQGLTVTGSDLRSSRYTRQLEEAGIVVHIGHAAENVPADVDVVVVSTAILDNNPELVAARERGCEIWHRAKMLAYLGRGLDTLAVAGTHGKTTTSSMLATVLDAVGDDPTFLIGGIVRAYGTNAHSGAGRHYVVEADESDKSFMSLSPAAVLVTNVEADHLDHYRDLGEIYELFGAFIGSVPDDGVAVVCGDDEALSRLARERAKTVVTYGFGEECDVRVERFEQQGIGSSFLVRMGDGRLVESSLPQSPGAHNAANAAGVIALCDAVGIGAEAAARALSGFRGVRRRFDLVGKEAGVTVVDDYAHHPTEIAATIAAASKLGYRRVHVLFQPHRYSRAKLFTDVLHDEFSVAFDEADSVTFMNVYPAGETPVPGVSGKTFLDVVLDNERHPQAAYVPRRIDVAPFVADLAEEGDLVITMGAGDVTSMGPEILDELASRAETAAGQR